MRWMIPIFVLLPGVCTAQEGFTPAQLQSFERTVRPILAEHCLKCHGPEKQWAGLRLDSRDAILKGGETGPAAIPGEAAESLLIRAVRHDDDVAQMPEDGRLSDLQIQALTSWIQEGLPFPQVDPSKQRTRDRNHWSFQPVANVVPPEVSHSEWVETDIDRFILKSIENTGLIPAEKADRRALIRRVTFDLTGLPPTPEEVSDFLADTSDDAWSRLQDRLLTAPAYGEHWGRHWLDVARYADSNGLDENVAHGNAWRYRDYVVRSFNADKPIDQFIREQLAGDLLPAESPSQRAEFLTATGFLSIGPKVLAEVNQPKMRMDIVDEQIDTVGRVFLGMTFGCARCHDHKFDPISTDNYYGLAGIFRSTRTMETYTKVAKWHEHLLDIPEAKQLQADYAAQLALKKQAVATVITSATQLLGTDPVVTSLSPEEQEARFPEATRVELAKLREDLATLEKSPPDLPSVMGVAEDEIADVAVHIRGNPSRLGAVVSRHTPDVIQGLAAPAFATGQSGRRELVEWLADPQHPMTARVFVNRVWRWHFGEGLVRSIDNFGLQGERPTHPELLDWLAQQFVDSGWSMKSLHRLILNSRVYQQGHRSDAKSVEADPDNRLWTRMPVRRLQAEEVRDSLLFVSDQLDRTMGGSLLKVKNRGYLFDHTSIDTTDYSSRRRSLYLPVIRNNVYDVFQLLDFPDPAVPAGDRSTTTVAPQALLIMNSDLVQQAATDLAARLLSERPDPTARLQRLYQITLQRDPSVEEQSADLAFLDQLKLSGSGDSLAGSESGIPEPWSVLCHTILASNEFLYVE
jgi:hypothetical protein